jgi:hypothetical protein
MKLTAEQIAQYAANAGFDGNDLIVAVAVALAESSGEPDIQGDWTLNGKLVTKGTPGAAATSYGLWQIHWTVHPETYSSSPSELFDPQVNANAAFSVWKAAGGSFSPWSTFNNAMYAKYLDTASEGVNA